MSKAQMEGNEWLRELLRQEKGKSFSTYTELAEKSGVNQGNLSCFMKERGDKNRRETMTFDSAWKILKYLGAGEVISKMKRIGPNAPVEMELKRFVSDALCEIIEGIKEAQEKTADSGATINPLYIGPNELEIPGCLPYSEPQPVNFDLAVTINNKTGGGFGINVLGASIGSKLKNEEAAVSRIHFTVEVQFPLHKSGERKN